MHNDLVVVETGLVRDGLARVLGGSRELQSLGEVECGRGTDLAQLLGLLFPFLVFGLPVAWRLI